MTSSSPLIGGSSVVARLVHGLAERARIAPVLARVRPARRSSIAGWIAGSRRLALLPARPSVSAGTEVGVGVGDQPPSGVQRGRAEPDLDVRQRDLVRDRAGAAPSSSSSASTSRVELRLARRLGSTPDDRLVVADDLSAIARTRSRPCWRRRAPGAAVSSCWRKKSSRRTTRTGATSVSVSATTAMNANVSRVWNDCGTGARRRPSPGSRTAGSRPEGRTPARPPQRSANW